MIDLFFMAGAGNQQRSCLSGAPVFINKRYRQLKQASLPAALNWDTGGFWVSAVTLSPLHPRVGHQTSVPISLVRVPILSSVRFPIIQDPELGNKQEKKCQPHFQVLILETAISPQLPFLSPVALTCQQSLPSKTDHPLTTKEMSTTQELYSPQHTHTHRHTHTHMHLLVKTPDARKNKTRCNALD